MGSRNPELDMTKSHRNFTSVVKLCEDAFTGNKVNKYAKMLTDLETNFFKFDESYAVYKAQTIKNTAKTEEVFNKESDSDGVKTPDFPYNDKWADKQFALYVATRDKLENVLEANPKASAAIVSDEVDVNMVVEDIKATFNIIKANIVSLKDDISGLEDEETTPNIVGNYDLLIQKLQKRIDSELKEKVNLKLSLSTVPTDPEYANDKLPAKFAAFSEEQGKLLHTCSMMLVRKVKPVIGEVKPHMNVTSIGNEVNGNKPREHVHLEKTKPPKFNGDDLEFGEFKRKWDAQVHKANLPEESELDKLKDAVPKDAKDQLYGVEKLDEAWEILTKRYGNKLIIGKKLKSQLKAIQTSGKSDPERIVNLKIKVRNIVSRLTNLKMQDTLTYDSEFLSAVFTALPDKYRQEWLRQSKGDDKWADMLVFLDDAHDRAREEMALLSVVSEKDKYEKDQVCKKCGGVGHFAKVCPNKAIISAVTVKKEDDANNTSVTNRNKEEEKRKARRECGKCPLCNQEHTYIKMRSRDREHWPSDRLFKCDKFMDMDLRQRADTLERLKCCPSCTSWNHQKSDCRSPAKCGRIVNGAVCNGRHSSLVCGSGNAYCGAVRPVLETSTDDSSSSEEQRDLPFISNQSQQKDPPFISHPSHQTSPPFISQISLPQDQSFISQRKQQEESPFIFPDLTAETLLLFQEVKLRTFPTPALVCWDEGSTRCLVTHRFARACGMKSQQVILRLSVVGQKGEAEEGCYYEFELVRNDGTTRKIWAYGIEEIMEPPDEIDLTQIKHLFPHLPSQAFSSIKSKSVDILIGNNFLGEHPNGGQGRDAIGDLRAYQSHYGSGYVFAGTHPALSKNNSKLLSSAIQLARVHKCEVAPELLPSFWEGECLGVLPPKRCGKCLRCSDCSDQGLIHSRKDQEELDMLLQGVQLVNGQIHVTYPFKRDPHCLTNNREVVVKMAEKMEKSLLKSGYHETYNEEIKKALERGAAVKLTEQEIEEWRGPVNYIVQHGVIQDSVTTPFRVVSNSSLKNGTYSLNECLVRGPNSLNSMLDISLRFRCHQTGLVFDLTKAYNRLKTGPVEKHLRRFVWRFSPDQDWTDFALDSVAFGDLPAANCLEIGRDKTADAGEHIDAVASKKLKYDSYVDDGVTGGSPEEVARMKGNRLADGSFSGTIPQILKLGGLHLKVMVSTGETNEEVKNLISNKVLGYQWNATDDEMAVNFPVYLCNKKRKVRTQPALTMETLKLLESTPLTKRVCLGITNGFLDFLGISCPFTIRFKLLMRQLYEGQNKQLKWEDKIPAGQLDAWKDLIAEAVKCSSLCFPRCTRPPAAVGQPLVVEFGDGALPAYSACVYLQWKMNSVHRLGKCDQEYDASLLWAKARVTPLSGYTVPRSELSGTVLGSRMCLRTVKALDGEASMKPAGVIMLADSKCTISAVDTASRALKPFFHNRVSEILQTIEEMKGYCKVEDIHYVPSDLNPADLATRNKTSLTEIGPASFWQKGPSFLCFGRDYWPVTRDFIRPDVPENESRVIELGANVMSSRTTSVTAPPIWTAIKGVAEFSNSIEKVKRILARLIKGWKLKSKDVAITLEVLGEPVAEELEVAEKLLLLSAMHETALAEEEGKLSSLAPEREGHIIVSRGRVGERSLSRLLGVSSLPILMPNTRVAYLFMVRAHEGEFNTVHHSVAETLARSREKVWIHKARDLARKVCSACPLCRRNSKKLESQKMSRIKEESLTVCRPWTFISLDFSGPIKVKGAVNSRARMKCWVIVYICRSTKAVDLLATCGYDTQSFLLKHEEFVARHGAPNSIISDRGTQLVSAGRILARKASKEAKDSPDKWDWSKITKENSASNWTFVPIGSQHFNGLPESMVKVLKRTLKLALNPGVILSYPELVTLLARISYTINSRPLGLIGVSDSSQQEDHMSPLTPNMMLLGRSSNFSPALEYSSDDRFCSRLAYITQVEKDWWDKWIVQVWPTLFSYKKWKVEKQNLALGDIVMLKYPGQFKDDYTIAKVTDVHPGEDGLVRQVTVSYKKRNSRESPHVYKSKPLLSERVAIHRLHKLHLVDEDLKQNVIKTSDSD